MMKMGNMTITDDNKTIVSQEIADQLLAQLDENGKKPEFFIEDHKALEEKKA